MKYQYFNRIINIILLKKYYFVKCKTWKKLFIDIVCVTIKLGRIYLVLVMQKENGKHFCA